ncbi:unnamed protein product, partial [Dovyalis caffra]
IKASRNYGGVSKRFEDIKSLVKRMNLSFTKGYLVKLFIGALREDLSLVVKRFKPINLREAFE